MGYYAASSGNSLQTFWDNLSVHLQEPIIGQKYPRICCPETSVMNYHLGNKYPWIWDR